MVEIDDILKNFIIISLSKDRMFKKYRLEAVGRHLHNFEVFWISESDAKKIVDNNNLINFGRYSDWYVNFSNDLIRIPHVHVEFKFNFQGLLMVLTTIRKTAYEITPERATEILMSTNVCPYISDNLKNVLKYIFEFADSEDSKNLKLLWEVEKWVL